MQLGHHRDDPGKLTGRSLHSIGARQLPVMIKNRALAVQSWPARAACYTAGRLLTE